VTLWVFEENLVAQSLYASFDFVPDGARRVEPEYGAQEIRLRRAPAPVAPAPVAPAPVAPAPVAPAPVEPAAVVPSGAV
jgi:hypothetical protein